MSSFVPTSVAGCSLWLDAADSSTLYNATSGGSNSGDGGNVLRWNDKSGNSKNATQTLGTPVYRAANQNGLGVVEFSNNIMRASTASYPVDVFVIVKLKSLTVHNDIVSIGSTTSDNFRTLGFSEFTSSRWNSGSSFGVNNVIASSDETSTGFLLMEWTIANNNFVIRRNGTVIAQNTSYTSSLPANSAFSIGFRHLDFVPVAGNTQCLNGFIGEIITYNSQLGDTDRMAVENYLANKWGLQSSMPTIHPASGAVRPVSLPSGLTPWVWYDAADSSTVSTSGTSVTGWMNKGSAAGGSGSVSGTVSYGSSNINGLPTVSIGSSSTFTTPSITPSSQSSSVFIVNRVNVNIPLNSWPAAIVYSAQGLPHVFFGNDSTYSYHVGMRASIENKVITSTTNHNGRVGIYSVVNSTTVANNTITINGASQTLALSIAAGGQTLSTGTFSMQLQSDVAEMLIFMGEITVEQRQQIEGYLAWKWGLQSQLPASHPYSPTVFTHTLSQRPLPTPWVWYDAADASTITKSGTTLTGWANKGHGGSGYGSVTGTATHGISSINGISTVSFSSGSYLTTPAFTASSQAYSYFTVARITNNIETNSSFVIIFGAGSGNTAQNNTSFIGVNYSASRYNYVAGVRGVLANLLVNFATPNQNLLQMFSASNSTTRANNYFGVNGIAQTLLNNEPASGVTIGTAYPYIINMQITGTTIAPALEVAEIIGFQGEMDAIQRMQVEGYLAWKWGLQGSLPASHPFYAVPYINRTLQQYSMPQTVTPWLWYDAGDSSTVMKNGTTVVGWANKGNGCQGYGTITGTVTHGSTTINGRTVMSMAGGSNFRVPSVIPTEASFTNFAVVRINGTMTTEWAVVGLPVVGSTQYGQGFMVAYTAARSYFIEAQNRAVSTNTRATISNPNGNFMLVSSVNSSSSTSNNFIGLNGTTQTLADNFVANSTIPTSVSDYLICPPAIQTSITIDVAEVIMFQGQLNTVQRQQVEGYLAWKWGLQAQLPAEHPYASTFIGTPIMTTPWTWFDAADASSITKSGTALTTWNNKGSAGGSASVSTGSATVGTELMNGRNTVTVASSSSLITTSIAPTQQAYSVFAVMRPRTIGSGSITLINATQSLSSGLTNSSITSENSGIANRIIASYSGIENATRVYSIVNSAISTASNAIIVDGSTQTLTTNALSAGMPLTVQQHTIMGVNGASQPASFAEVLIFMGEMTVAQRQQVEGYLAHKWGLQGNLGPSHPYNTFYDTQLIHNWSLGTRFSDTSFVPAGCRLWLDAAYPAYTDNGLGTMTSWADKMALTNATGTGSPVLRLTDLNGLNTIGLRGPTDYFTVANNFNEPGFTIVGMFRMLGLTDSAGIFSTDTANFYGRGLGVSNSNFIIISNDSFVNTSVVPSVNTWYICSLTFDATTTCRFRINGTSNNVTIGNNTPDNTTGFKIGVWNAHDAPTIAWSNANVDVAEVMCFNRPLSSTEVARIEAYMGYKWGIQSSLPSTHLLRNVASAPLSAPQSVVAAPASCAAIISWLPPTLDGGSPITGYRVTASNGSVVEVGMEARSARITGLTNGISYTFTVAAKNVAGYGPASSASAAVIPSANVAPVYNGGSYYFNGNVNSNISVPNAADLRFGTGDYTIEWWQYWTPNTASTIWPYARSWSFGSAFTTPLQYNTNAAFTGKFTQTEFIHKWRHIAVCRQNGIKRVFFDGQCAQTLTDTSNFTESVKALIIGGDNDSFPFRGFISQFHWVTGTALYTADFIPPLSIQPVANSKILLTAENRNSDSTIMPKSIIDYSPVKRTGISSAGVAWSSAGPYAPLVSMPYQREIVSTFAGSGSAALTDATGLSAAFNNNVGISIDASDNMYVADYFNSKIRMITPAGVVSSLAGTVANPQHAIRDSQGNIFATAFNNHQIWKLPVGGSSFVSFAGSTSGTTGYQDGTGANAMFYWPVRMAIDASDNLYVCDYGNHKIRRVTPAGVVSTYAGPLSGTASGTTDGAANSALFNRPASCAFDSQGNLFVTELDGHKIRKITPAGIVSTFAGAPPGSTAGGDADGWGTNASFSYPDGITIDKYDNIYVFDRGTYKIRKITPDRVVTTVMGNPNTFGSAGFLDGIDQGARFNTSEGMCMDSNGNLFVSSGGHHRIRRAAVGARWQVQTLAGLAGATGTAVGDVSGVRFNKATEATFGNDGAVYIADYFNNRIIKITPDGNAIVLAGSGTAGGTDGVGTSASFNNPRTVILDKNENIFVAEYGNHKIRKITPAGHVTTIAGTGTAGFLDGHGSIAQFNGPCGICIDSSNKIYVCDNNNNRIRCLTPDIDGYIVSTFAGTGAATQVDNTTAITSTFTGPINISVDICGTLYVAEGTTTKLRKIPLNGGAVSSITIPTSSPRGIFYNNYDGYVYYGDYVLNNIYRILPDGTGNTVIAGGTTSTNIVLDGIGTASRFSSPAGLSSDAYGNMLVCDYESSTIRLIKYAIPPAAPSLSASGATISWTAPANNGLPITGYDVMNSYGARVATLSASTLSYTATVGGTYRVRAINNAGVGTAAAITVSTTTVPGAPTGVVATDGSGQIVLNWTAPASNGGATITAYRVFLNGSQVGSDVSGTTTTITTGLTVGQSYQFTVRAVNSVGASVDSVASNSIIVYGKPGVPRNVTVSDGSGQAVVSWQVPLLDGSSAIIGYRIRSGGINIEVSANTFMTTVPGLLAGVIYSFNVSALNAAGYGPESIWVPILIFGKPGAPTNVVAAGGNQSAVITWSAADANYSTITNYRITSSPGGITADVSGTSGTISGLTNGTSYTFTVVATNAAGAGPSSSASNAVVPYTTPGAPRNVTATDGSGQVVVSWQAPLLDGSSALIGYRITDQSGNTTDVSANVLTNTFTNLVAGRTYSYTVAARNAAGYGTASSAASLLVFGKPGVPRNVSATDGSGQVVVSWQAPLLDGSSALIGYRITDQSGNNTDVSANVLTNTLSGLVAGRTYSYTVAARNAAGFGTASSAASLLVFGKPGAPTNVVAAGGNTSAVITWTAAAANSSTITNYRITSSPGGVTKDVSGTETSGTVSGLTNGTSYTFTVVATNAAGTGSASAASNAVVPNAPPTGPFYVVNLAGGSYKVGNTAATNLFTTPSDLSDADGIPANAFTYKWQIADVSSDPSFADIAGATASTYVILTANTGKFLRSIVTYTDSKGTVETVKAAAVGPIVTTVPYAPTIGVATAGNTQATVNWTAPNDGGLAITKYTITSSPGSLTVDVSGNLTSGTITGLTNGTSYTFTVAATNANGLGASSAASNAITPITVPSVPQSFVATAGAQQIALTWSAPASNGGSAIQYYRITDQSGNTTDVSGATSQTFTGLVAGRTYSYTIFAVNAAGNSATASASAMPYTVPNAPRNVTATDGSGQVIVSWQAPLLDGSSDLIGYRITDQSGNTTDVSANVLTNTFTGLVAGRTYSYTVAARNAAGYGTASSAASLLVFGKPGVPQSVSATDGSGQIVLSWSAPLLDGSSALISYRITDQSGNTTDVSANVLTNTFSGLVAGRTYSYTVAARNAAGYGTASLAASLLVFGKPGVPQSVSATDGSGQIVLNWSAPLLDGSSALIGYRITDQSGNTTDVSANVVSRTFTGLTAGTTYSYTVAARNAAGYGTASSTASLLVFGKPGAPTGVSASGGNQSAVITWTAAFANSSTITNYRITASPGGLTADVSGTSGTISGLTNGTSYTFTVVATNAAGSGPASSASNAVVPNAPPTGPFYVVNLTQNSGTYAVGNTAATNLYTTPSDLSDADGIPANAFTYIWQIADISSEANFADIAGSTASTYVILAANTGKFIRSIVSYTDSKGTVETVKSSAVGPIGTTVPYAPTIGSATAGNAQATVSWTAPNDGGLTITKYTITSTPGSITQDVSGNLTSGTITGLTNGTTYTFTVAATNANGVGASSAASNAVTPITVATAPLNFTATAGTLQLALTWSAPASNGGSAIQYYRIIDQSGNTTDIYGATSQTFTDLVAGSTYSYTIFAVNAAGIGASASASAMPYTVPGVPRNVAATDGSGQIVLSWQAPLVDGSSAIVGYRITSGGVNTDVSANVFSRTFTGLTAGTTYSYTVSALNAAGYGSASAAASLLVFGKPGAPTNVVAAGGNTTALITWSAPSANFSPITKYTITASNGATADVSGDLTYGTVSGLPNGVSYTFTVAAFNAAGYGSSSTASNAVVPNAPPTGPFYVVNLTTAGSSYLVGHDATTNLYTSPNDLSDADGIPVGGYSYQWQVADASDGFYEDVCGETQLIFDIEAAEINQFLRAKVSYTDNTGTTETVLSNAVGPIQSTVPYAPTGLSATGGDMQISLSWTAPNNGGLAITSYTVEVSPADADSIDISGTTALITGLEVNTEYTLTVYANNANGAGESASTSATTTAYPAALTFTDVSEGNGRVILYWSAPSNGGSTITSYTIYNITDNVQYTGIIGTSYTVNGLTNDVEYTFAISATNGNGEGSSSGGSVSATPYTAPDAPAGVLALSLNTGDIRVSWNAPADNGRPILGYRITDSSGEAILVPSSPWTFSGLALGRTYAYTVAARNVAGYSAESTQVSALARTTPTAPQNVVATSGNASVSLQWSAPASNGGSVITAYRVYDGAGTQFGSDVSGTSTTVSGLTNGQSYTFYVRAVNVAGESENSAGATASTQREPDAPTIVHVAHGNTFIDLSWNAPAFNGGAAILDYRVYYNGATKDVSDGTSTRLTGLTNGTQYTIQVAARNVVGYSQQSSSFNATPSTVPDAPIIGTPVAASRRITVHWSAPAVNGGAAVSSYEIYFDGSSEPIATGITGTSYTVINLTNDTPYQFRVAAVNLNGAGELSAASTAIAPFNTPPTGSVDISGIIREGAAIQMLNTLADVDGLGTLQYKWFRIVSGVSSEIVAQVLPSYTISQSDVGAQLRGMIYYTDAYGTNEIAYSAETSTVAAFSVQNLSAVAGEGYVDLSWNAPVSNGKTITGYHIVNGASTQDVSGLSARVSGLSNGQSYTISVAPKYDGTYGTAVSVSEIPYTVPDAPTIVSTVAGNASIRVAWNAPAFDGGRSVSGYDVSCNGQVIQLSASDLSYNVVGLSNGQSYTIEVRARNVAGAGAAASTSEIPYRAADAPTGLSAIAGNTQVALSWTAPVFNGGRAITGYRVYYGYDSVDVSGTSRTIDSLTNNVSYSFYVVALNAAGEGAQSSTVSEIPYTVPDAPTGLIATPGSTQISLSWVAPAGNGRDVDYYRITEAGGATYDVSGATSTIITDLINGTPYTYTVAAHNLAGFSAESASVSATPRTVPDAIAEVFAVPSDSVVDLSWNAPYNGGSAITQYRIVYGDLSGSTTSTSFRASGLTNGTTYVFYVYAINVAGSSTAQTVVSTPRTIPGTPRNAVVEPADSSIKVYWDSPTDNGGSALTGYRVAYGATSVDLSANTLEYTASPLTNGQSYTFEIYAVNVAGESATPLSITAIPRTTPDAVQNLVAIHKNGAVDLSWNAPAFNGGAAIQYYRVSFDGTYQDVSGSTATTISGLTNGTSYTFVVAAYNVAGYGATSSVSAIPSTLPGKPTITSAFGGNGIVSLNWSVSDGGAAITSSRIYYVSSIGGSPSTYDISGSATSATVSGLTNGTYYMFSVDTTNLNGTGAVSNQSSSVAPYAAPDSPVITSVVSHDGFMRIAWSHSGATGGFALSKFALYLSDGSLIKDSIDPTLRTLDISDNLTVGSSYQFKMKAFSEGLYSEIAQSAFSTTSSAVILGMRPAAPGLVDVSSGDATIRVSWNAPADGYYAITKYTIYSAAGDLLADNISPAATYVDISVPNGVPIAVKATATNVIGESNFSATTASVIPSRVPDQPTGLTAVHGDQQIVLSWTAPVEDGSANIIKYGVYYADGTAIDENVVDTSFNVVGLTNGQVYTFKVAAFNLRGRGAFSATASETPSRVPNAPVKPSATAGNRSAVVYWDAPAANGSAISLYEVYDASETKWADTSSTLVDISGLTNGVYYQFKVRAQNRDGFGAFSVLSDAVRPNADVSGSVDISGIFMEGQSIEAILNISDEDGLPALFNYQWQVASATVGPYVDISGAVQPTFEITSAYVRKYLRVYVSYTDLAGVPETIYSGYIGPVNDVPSGLDISGAAVEGQTVSADLTNFVDQDGYDIATFAYQWSDSSDGVVFTAIPDASASSFLLTQAQVDKYIRLVISYTDNTGMPHVISATTGPVANINNAPVGQPLISGTVAIGQSVSVDFSPVSDLDGIDMNTLSYQWQIADSADGFFEDVCGETQVSFEIDREKVNQFLRVQVSYMDLYDASEQVVSVVSSAVPATVADAPTDLAAAHGDTYVDLSWNAPAWTGGIDLSGYIVYRVEGATNTEVARTDASTLIARINGLSNGTLYVFKVSAYNAVGESSLSASASETPSRPASAPQGLSATHADSYISLAWSTPASDGGSAITAYKVFNGATEVASVGGAIRAVDISGLTNGVSYTFDVYAVNRNGLGSSASASAIPSRAPDAPASISAQYGVQQITISWTAPVNNGGAAVLGYFVYGSGLATQDVSGLTTTFTGLTNGTTYSFYVRAYNLNGLGASSATVEEYPNTTPSAPLDISSSVGNTVAYLTWSAPLSNGGAAIEGYRIYEGSTLRGTAGPSDLSGTATGLTNGVPSILRVVAYNRSGEGVFSTSITVVPNGFATAVQNLTATSGNALVSLAWNEPTYNGGTGILDYVVKTYSGATLVSTTTIVGLSGDITGLTNGITYTFRVYGRTLAGLGDEASITSKPYTVPSVVRSLTATRGDGQMTLNWVVPVSNGGDTITSYRIVRDGGAPLDTGDVNTSRLITGLNNGQVYVFGVQAQNARGFSTAVDVSGTPSRAPDAITDASGSYGDQTATLFWNAPYDGGSAIVRYRVYLNGVEFTTVQPNVRSYPFTGLTNGTTYTMSVRAENHTLAANSNIVSQTPRTLPSAPTGVAVDPSRNLVRVSWTVPYNGGATITRFEVGDVSAGNAIVATVSSATATFVDVSGLTNGQAYRFIVRAVNSEGAGPWSTPSAVVFPGDVPSKPSITNLVYGNQSITVSWSAPTELGGFAVDSYRIYYTSGATYVEVSGNVLTTQITGLTNGTLYQFTVYAVNYKGVSAASDISTAIKPSRFPDAPAKPTVVGHGDGSISIQWTAPYDGGDAIQGYRVYIVGSDTVRANPLGATTSATITGLTNGTNYQFVVHAYNRDGPSALSVASNAEFPSRAADAAIVNPPTHDNQAISISWSKPYDGGAPISYYRIYRQTVGTNTWTLIDTTANGDVLSTQATGLENGVSYIFRVDTVNRDGITASAPSAAAVPSTIPNAPTDATAVHGNGFATLSWTAPSWNGGNAIIGYRIFDLSANVATATPLADVSSTFVDISGLANGTTYFFKALGYNINGQGELVNFPAVIPSRIPDAVVVASAKPGDRSTLLRWTTPYDGGAPITSYRIYDAETNNVLRDVSGSGTLTTFFQNLTNGQTYSYRVKAYNLNGFSASFSNDVSATPFLVDLSANLPPKQQETIITTIINRYDDIVGATVQQEVPLVATTVDNNKTTGLVSVITSDPKLSNVMVANIPTEGSSIVDELTIAISAKIPDFGIIVSIKAFRTVQVGETITRTKITDFTASPLTIVVTLPGETVPSVDVYTRRDGATDFTIEGKATLISAAAHTYQITVSHLTEFVFKVMTVIPCFPMGTRILTAVGYKAVEKLTGADRIITSDGRVVPFARAMELVEKTTTENAPYLIPAHTFGRNQPPVPITLSPHHAFQSRKGVWQIPQFAAVSHPEIRQVDVGRAVLYFHLKLPNYLRDNVVIEGGVVAESYGGSEYGTVDTIYKYSSRLDGFTRRSTNKDAPKATLK